MPRSTRACRSRTRSPSRPRCTAWRGATRWRGRTSCSTRWAWRRRSSAPASRTSSRAASARALALRPRLLILDEPVSALDKSVEAQVLNLLVDLKARYGLSYLFISHDLNVVQYMADRVLVMYLGKVAEVGAVDAIYGRPAHPYTAALLASRPSMDPARRRTRPPLQGDPPNPIDPPSGCRFRTRCAHAEAVCAAQEPALAVLAGGHAAACLMNAPGSGHRAAPVRRVEAARVLA